MPEKEITKRPISGSDLQKLLSSSPSGYRTGLPVMGEDIVLRGVLNNNNLTLLYKDFRPFYWGPDLVVKKISTNEIIIMESKMTTKVGRLKTFLPKVKIRNVATGVVIRTRQMTKEWIRLNALKLRTKGNTVGQVILNALDNDLLKRNLWVINHEKIPRGWTPIGKGKMGLRVFYEDAFKSTSGFE